VERRQAGWSKTFHQAGQICCGSRARGSPLTTLYLDTSSLVKLYVSEDGTDDVRSVVAEASILATSVVAYPEARAAFARRNRERALSHADLRALIRDLDREWPRFLVLEVTDAIARHAGDLAQRYQLRGYDAVHLATFVELANAGADVEFSSFDDRLNHAAAIVRRRLKMGKPLA
jgi:predicted nucleic acid-binding protein